MRSSPNPLKNSALQSVGEAKIDGARTAFAGRGVLIPIPALSHQGVSVGLGYLRLLRKGITCSK